LGVTNRIAFWMAGGIALFLVIDWARFDMTLSLFLARRFIDLVDWVVFWR